MKTMLKRPLFIRLLLLWSFISCSSAHALLSCHGCLPEQLLRSEAYGIDLASDFLAIAVQHVNGTLEPIAMTNPGPRYRALMSRLLTESNMHPYGYGNDLPEPVPGRSRDQLNDADISILSEEISNLVFVVERQGRSIRYYSVSMPMFFTTSTEDQIREVFRRTKLPEPCASQSTDSAVLVALNTTRCQRHFEFNCAPVDYNSRTIIFLEYSNSTLGGSLIIFWGGWYYERIAYFSDARHENRTYDSDQKYWKVATNRIRGLIEDNLAKATSWHFNSNPLDIVVLGKLAFDPSFHEAVRDALGVYTSSHAARENTLLDPLFVAAMGAARSAKKSTDTPQPRGCNSENVECTKMREQILQDSFVRGSVENVVLEEL